MLETLGIFSIPGGAGSSPGCATSPLLLLCGSGASRGCCCAGKGFPGITTFPLHPFPPLSVALLRKPFSCLGPGWQRGLVAALGHRLLSLSVFGVAPRTGSQVKVFFSPQNLGILRIKRLFQNPGKSPPRAAEGARVPGRDVWAAPSGTWEGLNPPRRSQSLTWSSPCWGRGKQSGFGGGRCVWCPLSPGLWQIIHPPFPLSWELWRLKAFSFWKQNHSSWKMPPGGPPSPSCLGTGKERWLCSVPRSISHSQGAASPFSRFCHRSSPQPVLCPQLEKVSPRAELPLIHPQLGLWIFPDDPRLKSPGTPGKGALEKAGKTGSGRQGSKEWRFGWKGP